MGHAFVFFFLIVSQTKDRGGSSSHLPAADSQKEANHIRLLLLLKLLDVLKGTHLERYIRQDKVDMGDKIARGF